MAMVDLTFVLTGYEIPLDHGYALYSAVSRCVRGLHDSPAVGIHPIRGLAAGGLLRLTARSSLCIRTPAERIPDWLVLGGRNLDLDGHVVRVGVPRVLALKPAANLAARMVTIKGFTQPQPFLAALRRQMQALGISPDARPEIPSVATGRARAGQPIRRTLRVKDKTIVGYAVRVLGLTAEESLSLQENGLGGRRRMGCGIFLPFKAT